MDDLEDRLFLWFNGITKLLNCSELFDRWSINKWGKYVSNGGLMPVLVVITDLEDRITGAIRTLRKQIFIFVVVYSTIAELNAS